MRYEIYYNTINSIFRLEIPPSYRTYVCMYVCMYVCIVCMYMYVCIVLHMYHHDSGSGSGT
jgi:hypothetical protein